MQAKDLRPAKEFAIKYGVKSMVYGPPGTGKTPVVNTAPRPVLLAVEPGLLSMRNSTVPTYFASNVAQIDEFFAWVFNSKEVSNFDTVAFDSVSYAAEMYLEDEKIKTKDGRAVYGNMANRIFKHLKNIYHMPEKHVYLICKQEIMDDGFKRASFPGKELHARVPHLYDLIMNIGIFPIPGVGEQKAFRTKEAYNCIARDRSESLNEFEPTNLTTIFNKCMNPNL